MFNFQFFFQLLCISLLFLIFCHSAQILLENVLFCRQNARLKNRLLCSKFCWQNLSKPSPRINYRRLMSPLEPSPLVHILAKWQAASRLSLGVSPTSGGLPQESGRGRACFAFESIQFLRLLFHPPEVPLLLQARAYRNRSIIFTPETTEIGLIPLEPKYLTALSIG